MMLKKPLSITLRTTKNHLSRLEELGVKTVQDLLLFFPRTHEDKRAFTTVAEMRTDQVNNVKGTLNHLFHKKTRNGKHLTRAIISDATGSMEVLWFNQPFLQRVLKNGMEIILSGKVKYSYGKSSLLNPGYEEVRKEQTHSGRLVPVYHQTEGINSKWIREKLKPLIQEWLKYIEEYLPEEVLKEQGLLGYREAIQEIHFPADEKTLIKAKQRLSFDELFLLQLKAIQKKWLWQNVKKHEQKPIPVPADFQDFLSTIPFELTGAQKKALSEILDDLQKPYPMSRLLQGDVGSGKTVVAAAALWCAMKEGYQGALMAPTEILAKQHYVTLLRLLQPYAKNIQFITGSMTAKQKQNVYDMIKMGTVDLVIGTHSLIQEGVQFKNLGLAVIDEQHRFGVKQRDILQSNGTPHLLNLSATPIPRTLAMTLYGDQDLSVIDEMPKGRQPIITRVVPEKKRIDAYRWIENQVIKGRQAFIICPLIDESDTLEVKSAVAEYEHLQEDIFPNLKVGLLHGKMKAKEKEEIMQKFKENKINILVSTSVIEVGIDVPNASIMVIEAAERFGLSQLHQFRGRVGRGEHQSYCFLFAKNSSQDSRQRLSAMEQHTSGFKLAEIDLQLRGAGEIYGVRQSGIPDLKVASLTDSQSISIARQAAQKLIEKDPFLDSYPTLKNKLQELEEVFIQG